MRKLRLLLVFFVYIVSLQLQAQGEEEVYQEKEMVRMSYSTPQIFKINNIRVEGVQFLDNATIIAITGLKPGDEISIPGDKLTKAIKSIWDQKLVGDVQIYVENVNGYNIDLVIKLKERPRLSSIIINGTKKSERKDMEERFGFIRGQVVSDALVKNATINLKKYFREKGFYNVKVESFRQKDLGDDNSVVLRFEVDKGKKVKIKNINIEGNQVLDDKKIKKKFKNTKEKNFLRIFKRSKYIADEFETDKAGLINYYHSLGYRDFEIVKDSAYNVSEKLINLDVVLDEGQQYFFRNISWTGNHVHSSAELDRILDIRKGDIYNQELLNTRLNFNPSGPDVSSLYLDDGYLFFSVNPVEVRVDGDSIDLEIRVFEGQQATINKVTVSGNSKTNDHVILREIRTLPGEKFSRADLIRTQREIAQLGYFDPEHIGIIPVPNPADGTVDIHYEVVEKPSDQLQLSGGWGGAAGFVGTLGLAFNNFSLRNIGNFKSWDPLPTGDGQRLSLRVQANGLQYQSYSISFTEPWLGGKKPISFSVSLARTVSRTLDADRRVTGFIKVNSVTLSLGKRLKWPDDYFTLSHSLSWNNYDINNYSRGTFFCTTCEANNFYYGFTIARNNIGTNPNFPTRGANVSLSTKFTPPYSLIDRSIEEKEVEEQFKMVEYYKFMFDNSWFFRLSGNTKKEYDLHTQKQERPLVLNLRFHMGFIGPYNNNLGVGPFERFQVGGDGLSGAGASYFLGTDIIGLRGYDNYSIVGADGNDGVVYDKFVMELRFPVITQGIATIYLLGFAEAGNNWSDPANFNPYEMYRSTGFGARIFMPAFGMLGVDWGYGLDNIPNRPGANGSQIHFVIGQQIR